MMVLLEIGDERFVRDGPVCFIASGYDVQSKLEYIFDWFVAASGWASQRPQLMRDALLAGFR